MKTGAVPEQAGLPAARHSMVTIWPRVQAPPGANSTGEAPRMMLLSTAHRTAGPYQASAGTSANSGSAAGNAVRTAHSAVSAAKSAAPTVSPVRVP